MNEPVDRAFVERQVAAMPGVEADELAARLRDALGDGAAGLVDAVLADTQTPKEPLLARTLDAARSQTASQSLDTRRLAGALAEMRADAASLATQGLEAFQGLVVYVTFLTVILLCIIALFSTSVLPQFEVMFDSFGSSLPQLTLFVLSPAGKIMAAGVPVLLVVGLWATLARARRVLTLRTEAGGWLYLVPAVRKPFLGFRLWLVARVTRALALSGVDAPALAAVLEAVASDRGPRAQHLQQCLVMASRLGTLDAESRYWLERTESEVLVSLAGARDRIALTVQLALGLVAGLLVIAMYLPLFALGSAL